MAIKELQDSDFSSFISKGNTIIDFHAEWCGPCKMMEPQFKKASDELHDVRFGKVDVDKEYELAGKFQVMSIPTTLFFKNGEMVDRHSGAMTADMIKRKAKEAFG